MGREVSVGRVMRPHGIHGEVVVSRFGEAPGVLKKGAVLTGRRGEAELTLTIAAVRPFKQNWIVAFEGFRDRSEAEALMGTVFYSDVDALPPLEEGTYYRFDLIGLEAVTVDGETIGKVEEVWETGANDLLVVRGPRGEILIPAVEPFVAEVDLAKRQVTVKPVPGMIPEEEA